MENWPENWRFCIFGLDFAQILALFAALIALTTHLCLTKYIFCIVFFAQLFFQSNYGFTALQMENWPQNLRFCIFYLHFAQILAFFHLSELLWPICALESAILVFCYLQNYVFCPFKHLQYSKIKIGLEIVNFVFFVIWGPLEALEAPKRDLKVQNRLRPGGYRKVSIQGAYIQEGL